MMNFKFENIFAFSLLLILCGALIGAFIFSNEKLIDNITIALIGTLASVTAFFFTKHNPNEPPKDTDGGK